MSAENPTQETPAQPSRYWLTMFHLGDSVLDLFASLDSQERLAAAVQEKATDPTSEARVFTDEDGEQLFVALSVYEADQQLALSESLAIVWRGLEAVKVAGQFSVAQARIVATDRLGSTSVEDAWPAMEYIEAADLKATLAALADERAAIGTFIESN